MEDKRRNMKIKEDKGQKKGRRRCLAERLLSSVFFCLLLSSSVSLLSCSEENTEEGEYDNWQVKNDEMTSQWASQANNGTYNKILTYSKDASAQNLKSSDYIYVETLTSGSSAESPIYTDTVRVAYRGRLLPSKTYSDGYVFDQTYLKEFDWRTANVRDLAVSGLVDGFSTALMNMHRGDRWCVRIPYQLGYGSVAQGSSVPAYSNLVFDIVLQDFWHPGEVKGKFKTR
jgi:FKBP-type peptidyl-prolyl cis-trans isomerase FklB